MLSIFSDFTRSDASAVSGWASLGCWLIVYSPQIWENFVIKSGDGLSVSFILLWLAGDLTNLAGGAMAHLLPTMIVLAVYYSLCDIILLIQVYYYRALKKRQAESSERQPLLTEETIKQESKPGLPASITYPLLTIGILAFGFIAWHVQRVAGHPNRGNGGPVHKEPKEDTVTLEWISQSLGYASAALYLGSRIPQIVHNYKTRCEGLSLAMFFFSVTGNVTYVASILFKSTERTYILANLSWMIGSGGTVFLDLIVLGQFVYFDRLDKQKSMGEETDGYLSD